MVKRRAGLLLGSVLVALLGGEILLRLCGIEPYPFEAPFDTWGRPDKEIGWTNNEGAYLSNAAEGSVPMAFWSEGRRATAPSPADVGEGAAIVFVGGSFTQGYAVTDGETFPYIVNRGQPGSSVENYGTGAYSTYQSYLMMQRVLARKQALGKMPKVIIYGYFSHHRDRNTATVSWIRALNDRNGDHVVPPHAFIRTGKLAERPWRTVQPWPGETRSATVSLLHDLLLRLEFDRYQKRSREVFRQTLLAMDGLARENDARFIVALLDFADPEMVAFMDREDIASIDCFHAGLYNDPEFRVGALSNGHPSGKLHAYWGWCINQWLNVNPP
jgi:hypothetical protein